MDKLLGLLRVHVLTGENLAVRDVRSSDPYVVLKMGKQKLKTRVINNNVNPEWNEDLTLSISDTALPIKLLVYDRDTFTKDDKMGDAEVPMTEYVKALKMDVSSLSSDTTIATITPSNQNCLAKDSYVRYVGGGTFVQDMCLRLRNVECGQVNIKLQWVDLNKG